ncbi:hypothetical protein NHJ13734_001250 [Beauveria thailandica]
MFILTKISDLVQIAPEDFSKRSIIAIEDNINAKYANKMVTVEFRMIVFRPFKGEVIIGRIRSSTPAGINVRTDFFDDIFVPNHSEQLWIWNIDEEERLFYDTHEMVRLQVVDEEWHDQTPIGPMQAEDSPIKTPYRIKGSMFKEGLGVCLWWDSA